MNILVVTTVGRTGLLQPLLEKATSEFKKDVIVIDEWLPRIYKTIFLFLSIRLTRINWYRRWSQLCEKTPFAFRIRSQVVAKKMRKLEEDYDIVFGIGVLHDIPVLNGKPLFLFIDSTRMLSLKNPQDVISKLPDKSSEEQWLELEKSVYSKATRIFVGSKRVRQSLISDYGINEDKIIVTGFGPGSIHPEPVNKKYDGRTVLFVGKGDFEKKGGNLLLEAFKRVKKEIPDAVLHIAGQKLKDTSDDIISYGYVSDRNELNQLMADANVFVLPSLIDRYAMTIVEAMASKTPCVISDHGALPGILGESGIVVPKNDAAAVAKAITMLLKDQHLCTKMGGIGRIRYEENYNWDNIWTYIKREFKSIELTVTVKKPRYRQNKTCITVSSNY